MILRKHAERTLEEVFNKMLGQESENESRKVRKLSEEQLNEWLDSLNLKSIRETLNKGSYSKSKWRKFVLSECLKIMKKNKEKINKEEEYKEDFSDNWR
jgi:transposase